MSARTTPSAPPDFGGLSPAQVLGVLETIAVAADTLSSFAAYAAERAEGEGQYDLHAIQNMAERIGVLAELPSHEDAAACVGHWFVGKGFRESRDEH